MQKSTLKSIFLAIFVASTTAYAVDPIQMNALNNAPPPHQQFITADEVNNQPESTQPISNNNSPQNQQNFISQQNSASLIPDQQASLAQQNLSGSTQISSQPQAPMSSQFQNSNLMIHTTPPVGLSAAQLESTNTSEKLSQLQQDNANFQDMMVSQLSVLQQQNKLLNMQLVNLSQALLSFKQQLENRSNDTGVTHTFVNALESNFAFWLAICSAAVLILVFLLISFRGKLNSTTKKNQDESSIEYDYLASNEAWPAKLDLARAYIAMEDFGQAKKILKQLLQADCDKSFQDEANKLLKGMSTS